MGVVKTDSNMGIKVGRQVANSSFDSRAEAHTHPLTVNFSAAEHHRREAVQGHGQQCRPEFKPWVVSFPSPTITDTLFNFFLPQVRYQYGAVTLPIP